MSPFRRARKAFRWLTASNFDVIKEPYRQEGDARWRVWLEGEWVSFSHERLVDLAKSYGWEEEQPQ